MTRDECMSQKSNYDEIDLKWILKITITISFSYSTFFSLFSLSLFI